MSMKTPSMKAVSLLLVAAGAVYGATIASAAAEPHYRAQYYYPPEEGPYYLPPTPPVGFVFMRHTARCDYPRGWSVTDLSRNVNGIPRGGDELLATGCGSYDPLTD
jgi:hypothetical protein